MSLNLYLSISIFTSVGLALSPNHLSLRVCILHEQEKSSPHAYYTNNV